MSPVINSFCRAATLHAAISTLRYHTASPRRIFALYVQAEGLDAVPWTI